MGFFNLSQDEQARIDAMPGTSEVPPAGALEGLASAIPKGVAAGAVKVGTLLNDTMQASHDWFEAHGLGDDNAPAFLRAPAFGPPPAEAAAERERSAAAVKVVSDWAATGSDPRVTGSVGRIATGTAEGITIGVAGNEVAGPWGAAGLLGTAEGYSSYKEAKAQGVDETTAQEVGGLTGVFAAGSAFLPMKFGKTLAQSVVGGSLANVTLGGAQRGLTSEVLESHGYHEMASQYRIADGEAVAADLILGSAFGAFGHATARRVNPADVDAASAVAAENHYNRSAPGVPTDPQTATAHADTMAGALHDLANGDLPDIPPERAQQLVDNVVPDPARAEFDEMRAAAIAELVGAESAFGEYKPVEQPPEKPAPWWSQLWSGAWRAADFLVTGGTTAHIVDELPHMHAFERAEPAPMEPGAPWSEQSARKGVPLDPVHDAMLGHLVHNHGDMAYGYHETTDHYGVTSREPITLRDVAEHMQRERDEVQTFSGLFDVAAACAIRNGV